MNKYILIIFIIAFVTYMTRALPFFIWGKQQKISPIISYLGKSLPYAMMGLLIIYSFKNVSFISYPYGISELIAAFTCIVLHLWKRNNLLSICGSTLVYMYFIQCVF